MDASVWKKYVMTFSISVIVCMMAVIIALVFLLPKQYTTISASMNQYESVAKSDYSYVATKDISESSLVRYYTITKEQIQTFKYNNQYVAGNSDPFTPYSGNSVSGESTNNGSSSDGTITTDKITNSNGGVANPPSTNK